MSDTDTRAALLAAILDNPADDVPRLVYADWLEENGEYEHAEFIRVQCWQSQSGKARTRTARQRRNRRVVRILDLIPAAREWCPPLILANGHDYQKHAEIAAGALRMPFEDHTGSVTFQRGFISTVQLPWHAWREHHETLRQRHPIERVRLTSWPKVRTAWRPTNTLRVVLEDMELYARILGAAYLEAVPYQQAVRYATLGLLQDIWSTIDFELPED